MQAIIGRMTSAWDKMPDLKIGRSNVWATLTIEAALSADA
jgi:hypothetical protein